jgi:hypothetical protein
VDWERCTRCGATGSVRCSSCGGRGTVDCTTCGGTGRRWLNTGVWGEGHYESCNSCGGRGSKTCTGYGCHGGNVPCQTCGGKGGRHVSRPTLYSPPSSPTASEKLPARPAYALYDSSENTGMSTPMARGGSGAATTVGGRILGGLVALGALAFLLWMLSLTFSGKQSSSAAVPSQPQQATTKNPTGPPPATTKTTTENTSTSPASLRNL